METRLTRVRFEAVGPTQDAVESLLEAHALNIQSMTAESGAWEYERVDEGDMSVVEATQGWWGRCTMRRRRDSSV